MMDCDVETLDTCGTNLALSPVCEPARAVSGLPPAHHNRISAEATRILDDIRQAVLRNPEEARPAALRLVTLLGSPENGEKPNARGGLAPWQQRKIDRHVRGNLNRSLKGGDLAEQLSLSAGHFNRAFKETFGESPHAYIVGLRLEMAQELMLSTADPLSQIAYACGFADQSHFTKVFRRGVGQTPSAWRRHNLTEAQAQAIGQIATGPINASSQAQGSGREPQPALRHRAA
jgi:AraC family transcriptional regulator